jgi:hypothetical protein
MRARNRVGRELLYRPARLYTQPCRIGSLESVLGLLKSLKIWALDVMTYTTFDRNKNPENFLP